MLSFSLGLCPKTLAEVCRATLLIEGNKNIHGVAIDSRKVRPGDLFVAIAGERTDGHRYLLAAAEAGAAAVLIEDENADYQALNAYGCSVLLVSNTTLALGTLAASYRSDKEIVSVGVTGSVGKTTTKQFLYAVLSRAFPTHKTEGNYNNELGLPLTLLSMPDDTKVAVLEMGMSQKGEIAYLSSLAKPDLAVITTVGTSHIEYLGSREAIRDAKMEITEGLSKSGKLLLNGDEPLLADRPNAIYVAIHNKEATYRAEDIASTEFGTTFTAIGPGLRIPDCTVSTFGEHTVLDAMFAVAAGHILGLSSEEIRLGLADYQSVGMRQRWHNEDGISYLLDYYNASPESIRASLSVILKRKAEYGGRAVAVLGSVLELGEHSEPLHRELGSEIASSGVDLLFTFGKDASYIAEQARACGMPKKSLFLFPDITDPTPLAEAIKANLQKGDTVLMKASHSIGLERVAKIHLTLT